MKDPPTPHSARRVTVTAITAGVGLMLVALAVVAFANRGPDGQSAGALDPMDGPDPGMGRVHALAVDPGDDAVYAGTRYGLFRISGDGEASRVANRHQETKALAVLGPEHLLASGHPDPREDLPAELGLVESTDGGGTWKLVSLSGQADFHTLTARHGLVYGYDSSSERFVVSSDREQWDSRAEQPMDDVAVSPSDAAVVLAVSEQQLVRSADGGRTFTSTEAAPEFAALTWPVRDALFAVGAGGRVYIGDDAGATWSERGRVDGVPQAVVAIGSSEVIVATDTGIYMSSDGGRTFTLLYREQ